MTLVIPSHVKVRASMASLFTRLNLLCHQGRPTNDFTATYGIAIDSYLLYLSPPPLSTHLIFTNERLTTAGDVPTVSFNTSPPPPAPAHRAVAAAVRAHTTGLSAGPRQRWGHGLCADGRPTRAVPTTAVSRSGLRLVHPGPVPAGPGAARAQLGR